MIPSRCSISWSDVPLKDFLVFMAIGRLLTWLLQINGLLRPVWRSRPILAELKECDLCLGFWVYLILALFSPKALGLWPYLLDRLGLAGLAALAAHLIRLGWQAKFGITIID